MKRKILLVMLALAVVVGPALFFGCGNAEAPSLEDLPEDLFYNAVKEAAPDFAAASSSGISSRATTTWDWGDPIYELYGILVDSETGWDGYFNIYDVMRIAEDFFSGLVENGTAITEQPIDSLVDVGFNGLTEKITYDKVIAGTSTVEGVQIGYKVFGSVDDSGVAYMLSTYEFDVGEKSIIQGWYDENTGELAIGMFFANNPDSTTGDPSAWEIVKAYISGNTGTSTFSLKVIRDGNGYDHNIVGYGVSEGDGNYFLMHIANNSLAFTGAKYYEFAADATVSEIQAMDSAGSDTVPSNTTDYESELPTPYPENELSAVRTEIETLDVTAVSYDQ